MTGTAALVAASSLARVVGSSTRASAQAHRPFAGYGDLSPDPAGLLSLPEGFQYRVLSRQGDALSVSGLVPGAHDGMAAFAAGRSSVWLVRNHELQPDDVEEDGLIPVEAVDGATYDPDAAGGTTTLLVDRDRQLVRHVISLAGTDNNCGGGPTPWGTWLTCEETEDILGKPHGYIFEVDPWRGGNPEPIFAMGRFAHEAVAFDRKGIAYLSEDAGDPLGCMYRFTPARRSRSRGSLHAGGSLEAFAIGGLTTDLSVVQEQGTILPVEFIPVSNPNPGEGDSSVREQVLTAGATPIRKAEGVWTGRDGSVWFVASYAEGPDAEEAATAAAHSGQIWRYDPNASQVELVALFPVGTPFDSPDNLTVGPHGFAVACTDGQDDQWLVGITDDGAVFPFAKNVLNSSEFAGATFSPDGKTLFANIQDPGLTVAIWGPWQGA